MVPIDLATFRSTSRRHCDDRPADRREHLREEEPCSDKESDDHRRGEDNTYVADRIVHHVESSPRFRYVVRWYGYITADDKAEPADTTYLSTLPTRIGVHSSSRERGHHNRSPLNNDSRQISPHPHIRTINNAQRFCTRKPSQTEQQPVVLK